MLEFEYPWMFLVLLLPVLLLIIPAYRESREAVRVPFFSRLIALTGQTPTPGAVRLRRILVQRILVGLTWVLTVTALARPQWVEDPINKIVSARDLLLAVDLSGSMETRDFVDSEGNRIDRLEAVKLVLDDFIARREGDRIALIIFGTAAFLQSPFTLDHKVCRSLLDETQLRMAGPQTVIGDAIGLAIKLFDESEAEHRVMILLTDGNDTGSKIPPHRAAAIAAGRDVTIHTIAMGDPASVGEEALDLESLQEISDVTGGKFFVALDRQQLEEIYGQLDEIEALDYETLSYRPKRPLFHWPLGGMLILIVMFHTVMSLRSLFRRWRGAHA